MKTTVELTNVEKINKVLTNKNQYYINEIKANKILESEYQRQAVDFLIETGTTCSIEFKGLSNPNWDKKRKVNAYDVTLKNAKHTYTFQFFDSISNTENSSKNFIKKGYSTKLDFYSVLACIGYSTPESFDDFCSDFGYEFKNETEYIKAKSIHLACLDQDKNLRKLFNSDELQKLSEIN